MTSISCECHYQTLRFYSGVAVTVGAGKTMVIDVLQIGDL